MCDIITGLAQVLLFSLCQTVSLYPSLKADIVPGEMVIVMHESSAGVQDKHFICMLLPNKMTVQIKPLFGHVDHACRVCGEDGWKEFIVRVFTIKQCGHSASDSTRWPRSLRKGHKPGKTAFLRFNITVTNCKSEVVHVSIFVWSTAWWWPFNPHFPEA